MNQPSSEPMRASVAGRRLRIASWNLHSCSAGLPKVAAQLALLGADLVALQEVDRRTARSGGVDQAAALARTCGFEHVAWFPALPWGAGEYGVALLSRWPLSRDRLVHLPIPAGEEPRVLGSARLHYPGGELEAHVTHLTHRLRSGPARLAQAHRILELLGGEGPHLLLGDFNDLPGSLAHQALAHRLMDVFRAVGQGRGGTYPLSGWLPAVRIDYVFASPELAPESAHVVRTSASDHHVLVAEVLAPARAAREISTA